MNSKLSSSQAAGACAAIVVGIIASAWFASSGWNWILVGVLLAGLLVVIGLHVAGQATAVLISERNLMSLSRFQMLLWTIIILSAYLVMVIVRLKASVENPLAVTIDGHLLALMGISTASLVGVPLIQTGKKQKEPDKTEIVKTAKTFSEGTDEVNNNRQGVLYGNSKASDARFADMFQGDELKNTDHVDLAKVQMFFFTIITAFTYCVLIFHGIVTAKDDLSPLDSFPALSEGMIALLGISQAGYLASKGVDHTKTSDSPNSGNPQPSAIAPATLAKT